jgi:hypothetical protein
MDAVQRLTDPAIAHQTESLSIFDRFARLRSNGWFSLHADSRQGCAARGSVTLENQQRHSLMHRLQVLRQQIRIPPSHFESGVSKHLL